MFRGGGRLDRARGAGGRMVDSRLAALGLRVSRGSSGFRPDFIVDPSGGPWPQYPGATVVTSFSALTSDGDWSVDKNVGLAANSRLAPPASTIFDLAGSWQTVGEGTKAFIDGSLPVTVGDISAHGTHANVYVVEITHVQSVTTGDGANGPHVGLWWETTGTGLLGEYLEPVYNAANIAAGELFVRDNPGRCFVHKVGSTNANIRTDGAATSALRYVFQLADSSDPATGGALRYADYHSMGMRFAAGSRINDVIFGRNTRKDCLSCNQTVAVGALPLFTSCAWLDTGCHANVGPSNWKKCAAYSRTPGSIGGGGAAWHNFTTVVDPRTPDIEDSYVRGFGHAVYSHGSGQTPYVNYSMTGRRLRIEDCNNAFSMTTMAEDGLFEDVVMTRVGAITGGASTVRRFTWQGRSTTATNYLNTFGSRSVMEDGVVNFGGGGHWTGMTTFGVPQAQVEAFGPFTFRRITSASSVPRFNLNSAGQEWLDVTIEDTVFNGATVFAGNKDGEYSDVSFLSASTISNSYIGPTTSGGTTPFDTLAEYQAVVPGAANDVILYDNTLPTFAGDPLLDPTITNLPAVVAAGMGVDPAIITTLVGTTLNDVPTLVSMGLEP